MAAAWRQDTERSSVEGKVTDLARNLKLWAILQLEAMNVSVSPGRFSEW